MKYRLPNQAVKYIKAHRRHRNWQKAVTALSAAVAFCTVYALILPAITLESKMVYCGYEEHQHTEACYTEELICGLEEGESHVHTEACYEETEELVCELEEAEGHTHSEVCYNGDGGPVCGLEERESHTHTEVCYDGDGNLACGLEEGEGHVHTEVCYNGDRGPVCGLEESEGHIHGEACYERTETLVCGLEESEGHAHGDTCYGEPVLTCGHEEHAHTLECYSNPAADAETAADWEASLSGVERTGVLADDLLAVAESQLGYAESAENYAVAENGTDVEGYTRYGAWYSAVSGEDYTYKDWNGLFALFCLNYAGDADGLMPQTPDVQTWIETLRGKDAGLYEKPGDYIPNPGDLVFIDTDADGSADRVGIVKEYAGPLTGPAGIRAIEGDLEGRAAYADYDPADASILGYGTLSLLAGDISLFSVVPEDLDGQSFVIVKQEGDNSYAMTAEYTTVNEVDGLASRSVYLNESGEAVGSATLWTFERAGETENSYYISTTVDGVKKYLYLYKTSYDSSNDGRGSLNLVGEEEKQAITVMALDNGKVVLKHGLSYVNMDSWAKNFWCFKEPGDYSQFILTSPGEFETVEGLNHAGTVINLFDYWTDRQDASDAAEGIKSTGINAPEHTLKFGKNVRSWQTDRYGLWNSYTERSGGVLRGLVKNQLSNGYPVLSGDTAVFTPDSPTGITYENNTTESLAYLFDPSSQYDDGFRAAYRNVGGLLRIDEHGYYYYNSQKNFAEYDPDSNSFIMYKRNGVKHIGISPDGQFFPFNSMADVFNLTSTDEAINHYFGMTLTTRFIQQFGGHTNASRTVDTVFEFAGDDDVWIFIDNVLVADLGGIHDAARVSIDFSTGDVIVEKTQETAGNFVTQYSTTLKEAFEAAGKEPLGGWSGDTFADNSYHTLKFFYLERGNTDSNMSLKYNLANFPETGIYKVNQYGDPVTGAAFAVYAANDQYQMLSDLPGRNGKAVDLSGDWSYDLNPDSDTYGCIMNKDGQVLAKALYTGTTDSQGEMVFVDEYGMPYTLAELEEMFGSCFLLREIQIPDGYRQVGGEVQLRITNHRVLTCNNPYKSGIYASPDLLVTAPNEIMLVREVEGLPDSIGRTETVNEQPRTVIDYYDADSKVNGTVFAVVLKYTGKDSAGLAEQANWSPVYGTTTDGFTVVDVEKEYGNNFIDAVIDTAQKYKESKNEFSFSNNGQMQGSLKGLPGDVSNYYYMLGGNEKDKTQYTVAYYWSSAASLKEATSDNTYRIDTDEGTAGTVYEFNRSFGATIAVPNLLNRLFVQKLDEDDHLVNGAVFAMYEVKETGEDGSGLIYYIADGGSLIYLAQDADGDGAGEASLQGGGSGTYQVKGDTGVITVQIGETAYTISPKPYALGGSKTAATIAAAEGIEKNPSGEDGTATFTNMENGTYYVREIAAPEGYVLNPAEVMVLVNDSAVYANAGTADDGVTVGRGPGYVVSTLDQFASQGDLDNTLTWIYEMMRVSGVSKSFRDSDLSYATIPNWSYLKTNGDGTDLASDGEDALRTYLVYAADSSNTLFNYTVNKERYRETDIDPDTVRRRLYTDVGWSYYEVYQDSEWGEAHKTAGAEYTELMDGEKPLEISNLFSRSTYIRVTDERVPLTSNLEISKTVVNTTLQAGETDSTSFTFTVELFQGVTEGTDENGNPADVPKPLEGSYSYTVYDVDDSGTRKEAVKDGKPIAGVISSGDTITLTDRQVVVIKDLPSDASYTITEAKNENYTTKAEKTVWTEGEPDIKTEEVSGNTVSGDLFWFTDDEGAIHNTGAVAYTNTRIPPIELTIKKVDGANPETTLAGAVFTVIRKVTTDSALIEYYNGTGWVSGTDAEVTELPTDADGVITLSGLTDGIYTLTETKAPDGYQKLKESIVFTVQNGKVTGDADLKAEDGKENAYVLTVKNSSGFELPNTGGTGAYFYIFSGLLLMAAAVMCGYVLRRREERRGNV